VEFHQPLSIDSVPTEEQRENYWSQGGNGIIHEIWAVLRDFEPTWKDSVTTQPSGLLETTWYYAKTLFRVLFMNSPTRISDHEADAIVHGDLKKAVDALRTGAAFEDPDAIFLLAEMNFYGNFSHPRQHREAFRLYSQLAELDGNSTAQYMLGLMYATGVGGAVERDQAKALLYHTFAAEQGNTRSEMTLAFRHHTGIGTPRDCNKASAYYKKVADKAMAYWQSGPPGGHALLRNQLRWVEITGGTYGEGASVSSSGPQSRDGAAQPDMDDVLEFLYSKERDGDYGAVFSLGRHYYEPPRGYRRNLRKAQRQFMKIARAYWNKDGKVNTKIPKGLDRWAGKSAAYIGRMFLRGEGMEQNFEKASTWLKRGVTNGDAFSQYHLGLMYRDGLGVPKDGHRAATYFKAAAEQGLNIAQSALGVLFLDQGDVETAGRYFEIAAGTGGVMEAYYYLAEMTSQGIGRDRNCGLATLYYKVVAERAEAIHSPFSEANTAFENDDFELAFVASLLCAEHGYENAQANVAHLLDTKTSLLSAPSIPLLSSRASPKIRSKLLDDASLALVYYTRSAKQTNIDSLLKMGDFYLLGIGTNNSVPDLDKASTCYTTAAESHHSAQALWNLGWMHENGVGPIEQDFHMAKRYYDLALEMNKEAYLPVKLALVKLRLRSWWNGVSGGKVNSIRDDDDKDDKRPKNWAEWITKFLDAAEEMDNEAAVAAQHGDDMELDAGRYSEGAGPAGMPGGDADEHFYEGDEWADIDDGLVESLIIVTLAGALALLVYARQARQRLTQQEQDRRRREREGEADGNGGAQQHAAGQGQNGGFFPDPGDPEFNNWVVGGVGH